MQSNLSSKGRLVIPEAIREQARLHQGDKVDIGFADGLVVIRKRQPLPPARIRALLAGAEDLPSMTGRDSATVADVVAEVRASRRRAGGIPGHRGQASSSGHRPV